MFPRIFSTVAADATVTAIIGTNPTRCYRHGSAPQGVVAPYATWFVIAGVPENSISDTPPVDRYTIQVDAWSDNTGTGSTGVETLAEALRDCLESLGHMTGVVVNTKDEATQRYRIGMQFDIWHDRPAASS